TESGNGILENFRIAFVDCCNQIPNKGFFLTLLAAWLALFHFFGNTTVGYIRSQSPSLYRWLLNAYDPEGKYWRSDDGFGVIVPFVVLGLFWWKRKQLLAQPLRTWFPGLFLVIFALALHIGGYMMQQ